MTAVPDNEESFDSLGLKDDIQRGIHSYGFEKPSSIQARAIPLIMKDTMWSLNSKWHGNGDFCHFHLKD